MIVQCDICGNNYDDARRWTLCPHPDLGDWEARKQIQNWKEIHSAIETADLVSEHEKKVLNDGYGDSVNFEKGNIQVKNDITHNYSNDLGLHQKSDKLLCTLSREKLLKLFDCLGLSELHKTQRIILDIDCEGIVRIYTKAMMMGNQFDDVFSHYFQKENK